MKLTSEKFYHTVRLALKAGRTVSFYAAGGSMRPFIRHGDVVRLVSSPAYRRGDVVMCMTSEKEVVLHYIAAVSGDECTLMGAANLKKKERCSYGAIIGKVEMSAAERAAILLWHVALPVRRELMWIYCKYHDIKGD